MVPNVYSESERRNSAPEWAVRRVSTQVNGGKFSWTSQATCGATVKRKIDAVIHGAAERQYALRRQSSKTVSAIAARRKPDQYLVSIAAAAASPASAAHPARRELSERIKAHIASAQSGISAEFWSNFKPKKL